MSSFFVGPETISATLMLVLKAQGPRSLEGLNELGRSFWMINALAMEQRYADENASDYLKEINEFRFEHVQNVDFETILKSATCLLYQCSEGQVPNLALFKKLEAIVDKYCEYTKSKAYENAPWGMCG